MNCLVDAQLPRRFAHVPRRAGHDALHTLDLQDGNRTPNRDIARLADEQERVVVTKDADFVTSHLVRGTPARLWLLSTDNLSNAALESLLELQIQACADLFASAAYVELTRTALILHR